MPSTIPPPPSDWHKCQTTHGTTIDGTFVAFKMPITGTDWDIPDVLEAFPDLNLVITLETINETDMNYYQIDQFKDQNVEHISCWMKPGKIPEEWFVERFFNVIDEILETNPNALIGVHDVNGINRTGYMICRYLIEKRGWNPQNAIDAFENARGEKMEKTGKYHKCIQDLLNRKSLSALWLVQCAYYCFLVGKYIPKFD